MDEISKVHIGDARKFQRYGEYSLAAESLNLAQKADIHNRYSLEIEKLKSFNYRKLGDYNMALLHINNALRINAEQNQQYEQVICERAVCLMNKGVIFEERGEDTRALDCYLSALERFILLVAKNKEYGGMVINSLLTIGLLYYKRENFNEAREYLMMAIPYFEDGKEQDRRYLAIINTLEELKE